MKLFKVTLITYDDSQKTEFYMVPKPDEYDENKMPVFQEKRLLESTEFKSFTQKAESPLITVKYDICEINDSYVQGGYNYERIQALESDNKINIIGGNEYSVQMDKLNRKKSSSADKKKFVPVAIASFFVLMLAVLVIFGLNKKKIPISEENAPESQDSEQSSETEMSAGVSEIQTSAITESTITSETVFTSSEANIASITVSAFEDEPVPAEDISVHFIDVGQGDCIYAELPNDISVLIDAGDVGAGDDVVEYLYSLNVTDIDYLFITHPHNDHIGGIPAVTDRINVGTAIMPELSEIMIPTTKSYENLLKALAENSITTQFARVGEKIEVSENCCLTIVAPVNDYSFLNDYSVVVKLEYYDTQYLFTGDIESAAENDILSSGYNISSSVMKVAHHGSDSSSSMPFIRAVSPKISIVSVGAENEYGHPSEEVIARFQTLGTELHRTDEEGTIIVKSDGTDVWVEYPPERDNDDSAADTVGGNSSTSSQAQTGKGTYKITFNANGGEGKVSPMSITAGFNVILPQEGVTRNGYDFVGWSLTAEKQYPLYDYSMPDNDVILYAIWQPKEYTVTYDSNGGLGLVVPHNVKVGDEVPLPLEGLENGEYTLVGWNTNKNSRSALKKYFMPDSDVTLYAVWSEKAQAKITLVADGQESSFVCNIGDELNCRDDFGVDKEGYIVSGWTLYDGYGDILQTMTVRGDTTLYATWEEATYINITIDCSYLNEEPKIVKAALDMNGHAKVELPVVDTAKNHKFGYTYGWSTSKNGTLKYYGGEIAEFDKPATVYRVRSIYYGGDGTKEQPYLINSWEHIKLMSEKGVKGYYRQIADIQLPDSYAHNSINVIPLEKSSEKLEDFYFSYDGGGYSIFNLHGIGGLFGNVTRSVIKNVVLDGVNICVNDAENVKIGNIVNNVEACTYSAGSKEYAAGNSSIKNCAVLNSTITISGGTVDYIGGAIGYGGSVCDTYINLCSIYVEANASVNNIGGIAGRAAEISSSYVVGLNVEGKIIEGGYNIKNLGGVVATGLGISIERTNHSYRYEGCNVTDTAVRNAVFNNAENIGGIISVAEGNNGSPYITRCYIANAVMNGGTVGSIVGCDGSSAMRYTVSYVVVDDTNAYPNIGRYSEQAVSQTVFGAQILRVPYDGLKIDGISYVLGENWICDSNCNDGFAFPSKIKKFLQK